MFKEEIKIACFDQVPNRIITMPMVSCDPNFKEAKIWILPSEEILKPKTLAMIASLSMIKEYLKNGNELPMFAGFMEFYKLDEFKAIVLAIAHFTTKESLDYLSALLPGLTDCIVED